MSSLLPLTMPKDAIIAIGNTRLGSYPAAAINPRKPTAYMHIVPIDVAPTKKLYSWDEKMAVFIDEEGNTSQPVPCPYLPGRFGYIEEQVYILEVLGESVRLKHMKSPASRIVAWDRSRYGEPKVGPVNIRPTPPEFLYAEKLLFRAVWPAQLSRMNEDFAERCGACPMPTDMNQRNPLRYTLNGLKIMWDEINWDPIKRQGRRWEDANWWVWCVEFERRLRSDV